METAQLIYRKNLRTGLRIVVPIKLLVCLFAFSVQKGLGQSGLDGKGVSLIINDSIKLRTGTEISTKDIRSVEVQIDSSKSVGLELINRRTLRNSIVQVNDSSFYRVAISHKTGRIGSLGSYTKGKDSIIKTDGFYYVLDEKGNIHERLTYKMGKMDGSYIRYHENGFPMIVGQYKQDVQTGIWKHYDAKGKYLKSISYKSK